MLGDSVVDLQDRIPTQNIVSAEYLRTTAFLEWAMPYRTSDLCRVKAVKHIPACPDLSENYAVLQVFCDNRGSDVSTAYALVPVRLQYGRSNFPVSKSVFGLYLLECGTLYYWARSDVRPTNARPAATSEIRMMLASTSRVAIRLRIA